MLKSNLHYDPSCMTQLATFSDTVALYCDNPARWESALYVAIADMRYIANVLTKDEAERLVPDIVRYVPVSLRPKPRHSAGSITTQTRMINLIHALTLGPALNTADAQYSYAALLVAAGPCYDSTYRKRGRGRGGILVEYAKLPGTAYFDLTSALVHAWCNNTTPPHVYVREHAPKGLRRLTEWWERGRTLTAPQLSFPEIVGTLFGPAWYDLAYTETFGATEAEEADARLQIAQMVLTTQPLFAWATPENPQQTATPLPADFHYE